jgi:arabinose-5-phosphate isomerase
MVINYLAIAKAAIETEMKSIGSLAEALDTNFERAVELILKTTGKIVTSGVGKSGIAAQKIAATLSSIGTSSFFLGAGEASHGDLGMIAPGDTAIIISNSGASSEIVEIIKYCKSILVPIIAIVRDHNSFLGKESTISLILPPFSEVALKVPSTSFTLTSMIGDALVACLVEAKRVTPEQYKQYHPGGKIGASLTKVKEIMRTDSELPIIRTGSSMAEALILMTKKSLGCILVNDNQGNLLGIITDGDLRRHMNATIADMTVDEVMTGSPKTINSEVLISEALSYMNMKKITALIVAENKKAIGIVHIHDCLKLGLEVVGS